MELRWKSKAYTWGETCADSNSNNPYAEEPMVKEMRSILEAWMQGLDNGVWLIALNMS